MEEVLHLSLKSEISSDGFCLKSTCPKGLQFICPSGTYPAIPYCTIFPFSPT